MHDEVVVVEEDPFPDPSALDMSGRPLARRLEALFDGVGDRGDLPVARAVGDDEPVGEVAQSAEVQDEDRLALLVADGVDRLSKFADQRAASRE